jgi:hypothetical protein
MFAESDGRYCTPHFKKFLSGMDKIDIFFGDIPGRAWNSGGKKNTVRLGFTAVIPLQSIKLCGFGWL